MISVRFQGKPCNTTISQGFAPSNNIKNAEFEWFYEDLQDLLKLIPEKDVLCIIGDRNTKGGGNQEITWNNRHVWPWSTTWRARQRLTEFCQENTLVIANTLFQQHKRRLYTWTSPDGQYWNQTDYIFWSQIWRSSIQSAKAKPGADCGSDHQLLTVKFRLKFKKVGEGTRPFRYDLNQIPYDYTVAVPNRPKGLDLTDRVPEELPRRFVTLRRAWRLKPSPRKTNARRQRGCLRMLTNGWEKKQKAKEKGEGISNWMQSSREEQGDKRKPFKVNNAKK